jgi:tetratricopeptide (TPR) repeat protein
VSLPKALGPGQGVGISIDGAGGVISAHDDGNGYAFPDPATKAPYVPGIIALDGHDKVRVGEEARNWAGREGRGARLHELLSAPGLLLGEVCRDSSEIMAHFLRKLRTNAEDGSEKQIREAVIAVPPSIDASARDTIARAASKAGLTVLGFAPRPVAISLAAGKSEGEDGALWVLDFQEHLLDLSVLERENGSIVRVRGVASAPSLGAGEFARLFKGYFLGEFRRAHPDVEVSPRALAMLDGFAAGAVKALSEKTNFSGVLPFFGLDHGEPVDLTAEATHERMNELVMPLAARLERFLGRICETEGFQPASVLEVIRVGDAARIPAIKHVLETVFSRKLPEDEDLDVAASLGAAMIAAGLRRAGETAPPHAPACAPQSSPMTGPKAEEASELGYYELLGVHPKASRDEIKRAYFAAVRRCPPESDPEGYKKIREAYDVLMDPKARAKHDAFMAHGEEIVSLFFRAVAHRDADEPDEAERCLKRLLALAPDEAPPRNMLGLLQMNAKRWDDALVTFRALTKKEPEVAVYWANYAHAFMEKGDRFQELEKPDEAEQCYRKAIDLFTRAAALESFNASIFLGMAQAFSKLGDQDQALEACEKALLADGREDFQDFETFIFMCIVQLRRGALDEIERVARRVRAVLPPGPDPKKLAVARFVHLGAELIKAKRFQDAPAFMRAALIIDPDDEDLEGFIAHADTLKRADDEMGRFLEDTRVIEPLRRLALLYFLGVAGDEIEDRDAKIEIILKAIVGYTAVAALTSVRILEHDYPTLYSLNTVAFGTLKEMTTRLAAEEIESKTAHRTQEAGPQPSRNGRNAGGSCFVATAAFGTPHEPVIDIYRRYRDEKLVRSAWGRACVALYNVVGPFLAHAIAPRPRLRRVIANLLNRLAAYVRRRLATD